MLPCCARSGRRRPNDQRIGTAGNCLRIRWIRRCTRVATGDTSCWTSLVRSGRRISSSTGLRLLGSLTLSDRELTTPQSPVNGA